MINCRIQYETNIYHIAKNIRQQTPKNNIKMRTQIQPP